MAEPQIHTPHFLERKKSTYCRPEPDIETVVRGDDALSAEPGSISGCTIARASGIDGITIVPYLNEDGIDAPDYVESVWRDQDPDGTEVEHKAYWVGPDGTASLPLKLTTATDRGNLELLAANLGSDGIALRLTGHTARRTPPRRQPKKQPYAGTQLTPDAVHGRAQRSAAKQHEVAKPTAVTRDAVHGKAQRAANKQVAAAVQYDPTPPLEVASAGEKAVAQYTRSFDARVQKLTGKAPAPRRVPNRRAPKKTHKRTPLRKVPR